MVLVVYFLACMSDIIEFKHFIDKQLTNYSIKHLNDQHDIYFQSLSNKTDNQILRFWNKWIWADKSDKFKISLLILNVFPKSSSEYEYLPVEDTNSSSLLKSDLEWLITPQETEKTLQDLFSQFYKPYVNIIVVTEDGFDDLEIFHFTKITDNSILFIEKKKEVGSIKRISIFLNMIRTCKWFDISVCKVGPSVVTRRNGSQIYQPGDFIKDACGIKQVIRVYSYRTGLLKHGEKYRYIFRTSPSFSIFKTYSTIFRCIKKKEKLVVTYQSRTNRIILVIHENPQIIDIYDGNELIHITNPTRIELFITNIRRLFKTFNFEYLMGLIDNYNSLFNFIIYFDRKIEKNQYLFRNLKISEAIHFIVFENIKKSGWRVDSIYQVGDTGDPFLFLTNGAKIVEGKKIKKPKASSDKIFLFLTHLKKSTKVYYEIKKTGEGIYLNIWNNSSKIRITIIASNALCNTSADSSPVISSIY